MVIHRAIFSHVGTKQSNQMRMFYFFLLFFFITIHNMYYARIRYSMIMYFLFFCSFNLDIERTAENMCII